VLRRVYQLRKSKPLARAWATSRWSSSKRVINGPIPVRKRRTGADAWVQGND
jgi:hypothetical protein